MQNFLDPSFQIYFLAKDIFLSLTGEVQASIIFAAILFLTYRYYAWKFRFSRGIRVSKNPKKGTVYILQDMRNPSVYKVGFTRRSAYVRRDEVERDMTQNRRLKIAHVIKVPHAEAIEAVAHRRLKKYNFRSKKWRGREWFYLPGHNGLQHLKRCLEKSVADIAKKRRSRILNFLF